MFGREFSCLLIVTENYFPCEAEHFMARLGITPSQDDILCVYMHEDNKTCKGSLVAFLVAWKKSLAQIHWDVT
jgi:hypothetical protein